VTFIALLRAINLGSHNRIAMPELRALCGELGWRSVRSYIQSGNVVFDADPTAGDAERLEVELEQGIRERFGLDVPVIVRAAGVWRDYRRSNPFAEASSREPKLVMLGVSKRPLAAGAVDALADRAHAAESLAQRGDALWIHFGRGVAGTKLTPAALDRAAGSPVTLRNWRTVLALEELAFAAS
jgi:uncharacterized protein (DUF1697 family)